MRENKEAPVIFLQWDSDFFHKRIARVTSKHLDVDELARVNQWAVEHQVDCLYYLADGSQDSSPWQAEKDGYHLMDLRVTFAIDLERVNLEEDSPMKIELASATDLPEVKRMAGEFHGLSRFFADPHFDRELCKKMYEVWIERDASQPDRFLWVSRQDDGLVGYTSASINHGAQTAEIGLVGVNPDFRGQGSGRKIQLAVLRELKQLGVRQVEVVTQGRNIAAQNLYAKSGYGIKSIDLWYHKWF